MKKTIFYGISLISATLACACGEHYLDYECSSGETICRDNTEYKCVNKLWDGGKHCTLGCNSIGKQCNVEGCDQHDQNGACICVNGNNEDGTCKNVCVDTKLFNAKDGTCTCDCAAGCLENGLCKLIGNCLRDTDCNEYGYCSGNLCYCKESRCLLNDANDNHMKDYVEGKVDNRDCSEHGDADCAGAAPTGEKFCDNAMGYKCSVKCGKDTDCVDGFICRKSDGRCVSEYFTTVWDKEVRNKKIEIHVKDCSDIDVYWDWKDDAVNEPEHVAKCSSVLSHDYSMNDSSDDNTNVIVKIKGELNGVNFFSDIYEENDCALGCSLLEVRSFGLTGLALRKFDNGDERGAFEQCYKLEKLSEVDIPDPKKLTSMRKMFTNACSLNAPMEYWDVSNVTDMEKLFWMPNCPPDVSKSCFNLYPSFNQPLNRWNVSKVTNMNSMFQYLRGFNQSLDKWNVSNVTNMGGMFANLASFNASIGNWNVSKVTRMNGMFDSAFSFDQDLSGWDVQKTTTVDDMLKLSGISKENYCKLYKKTNGDLGAGVYANASMCK